MRYDPSFFRGNGWRPVAIVLVLLAIFPFVFDAPYARHLMILVFIYAMVASSWDLSLGYGGLFNFAHVALFAVGVYSYAILAKTLGLSPWLAIPAAGLIAMLFAALIALPVLRLDGIYVILVTIAFSQLIYQIIISQSDITGGTSGMVTLPSLSLFDYKFIKDGKIGYYYTGLVLLILSTVFLYRVTRSSLGRAIVALRDNKYYAMSRGVPEAKTRLYTLMASALFTGVAGGFYGSYVRVASPDSFGLGFLTLLLSMLLVGGAGTLWGPIIAAFFITFLSEWMADLGAWRNIIIALLIIGVMVFYPGGLWSALQEVRELTDALLKRIHSKWMKRSMVNERQQMMGFSESNIQTRHGNIVIVDTGNDDSVNKPAIVFIHGNSACKEAFQKQFRQLHDQFRLITFDLPGHGVSDNADPETSYNVQAYAEVTEAVITHAGVSKPIIFGWSLGGYVALELAARENIALGGLAICGTSPLNIVPDDFGHGYHATSHMELTGKHYLSPIETRVYANSATAPFSNETAYLHKNVRRTDGRARFYMITKLSVIDWPRQMRMLRESSLPFAIINGADDPFLNHEYIASLRYGNLWKGRPCNIESGKHAPFFNQAEEFNRLLCEFIADTKQ